MKAAVATGIEDIDKFLHVQEDWPKPTLATAVDGKTGKLVSELENDTHLIIKVLACALAPGDCRLFAGKTDMMQLPKWGRPYVIGSDVCGIVTEIDDETEDYFQVGDKIIARFDEPQPNGMCAEYACVKTKFSEKCPSSIPAIEACTLPASAAAARLVAQKLVAVQPNQRILLLGASGGLGTFFCQYAKLQGAAFLAATTTQSELVTSLGVDRVIDYRTENWWELESEFQDQPFDLVVDLVNGQNWEQGACSGTKVLKGKDTTYAQLLSGIETEIDARGLNIIPFVFSIVSRSLFSKMWSSRPKWTAPQGLDLQPGDLKSILEDVAEKRIKVVLDPDSPFAFETEAIRDAMKKQKSKHAHGKVVIEISKEEEASG
jgi:NADPH:quinone reductase-like Zn-dependent oxidoreductase